MPDSLEARVDKFIFRVASDRWYSAAGAWAMPDGSHVRIGMADFLQQRSGDIAFVEVRAAGTAVRPGDEIALVETVKANVEVASPVGGTIVTVNPALVLAPEVINLDPYGEGWLALIEAPDWPRDRAALLEPHAYLEVMREQAAAEVARS